MPLQKRRFLRYAWKVLLLLLITAIPLGLLAYAMFFYGDPVAAIVLGNAAFQMFITVPVSWFAYRYKQQNSSEIKSLKIALGDKDAHLDMLRAQINPHFLFNSLNTLYGTALQEKADRTGEGIQKLGDMMRFMLTENMQDRIVLNREIEYINNYISLQKLRTDVSPNIVIQTVLDDTPSGYHITPMLLIPFIENAFKHGISLREPSHIKISLSQKGGAIFFDVYNSKHTVNENDPERNNNGIGLANVRERLDVYYPRKHELIIRENDNEYFVHLTIQLD
jgi:LytS/YehU family sensor histidine kinase